MAQVLDNLIGNARKHVSPGGILRITLERKKAFYVLVFIMRETASGRRICPGYGINFTVWEAGVRRGPDWDLR